MEPLCVMRFREKRQKVLMTEWASSKPRACNPKWDALLSARLRGYCVVVFIFFTVGGVLFVPLDIIILERFHASASASVYFVTNSRAYKLGTCYSTPFSE